MEGYSKYRNLNGLYDVNSIFSKKILKKGGDSITITKIIEFSQATNIWATINIEKWKKSGLDDVQLENKKSLEDNISFGVLENEVKGRTYFDDYGATEIILNEFLKKTLNVPSFSQVLVMELANAKNWKLAKKITPKKYNKNDYVRAIEKIEFEIRFQIIKAYLKGDFYSDEYEVQECIFDTTVLDFETYFGSEDLREHRKFYEREWEAYHNK